MISPEKIKELEDGGDWFCYYGDSGRIHKGKWVSPPWAMVDMTKEEVVKLYEEELKKNL